MVAVCSKDVVVHIIKKLLQHAKQASNKVTSQTIDYFYKLHISHKNVIRSHKKIFKSRQTFISTLSNHIYEGY